LPILLALILIVWYNNKILIFFPFNLLTTAIELLLWFNHFIPPVPVSLLISLHLIKSKVFKMIVFNKFNLKNSENQKGPIITECNLIKNIFKRCTKLIQYEIIVKCLLLFTLHNIIFILRSYFKFLLLLVFILVKLAYELHFLKLHTCQ